MSPFPSEPQKRSLENRKKVIGAQGPCDFTNDNFIILAVVEPISIANSCKKPWKMLLFPTPHYP
jgi:hypothetical protein